MPSRWLAEPPPKPEMAKAGEFAGKIAAMPRLLPVLPLLLLAACSGPVNSPYPAADSAADAGKSILYSAFEERPKHLDPARSYSENEYVFLGNIYEPPLQYHFLKRPYQLEPETAAVIL